MSAVSLVLQEVADICETRSGARRTQNEGGTDNQRPAPPVLERGVAARGNAPSVLRSTREHETTRHDARRGRPKEHQTRSNRGREGRSARRIGSSGAQSGRGEEALASRSARHSTPNSDVALPCGGDGEGGARARDGLGEPRTHSPMTPPVETAVPPVCRTQCGDHHRPTPFAPQSPWTRTVG